MSKTALFAACKVWDANAAQAILAKNPDLVQARDARGRNALHLCAARALAAGQSPAASLETAKTLLDAGADVNAVHEIPDDGEIFPATALWYALARGQNRALASFLLSAGANADHCLWAAVWAGDIESARMLLQAGSKTELRFAGETPLLYAARLGREDMVLELVRANADKMVRDSKGRSPLDYALTKKLRPGVIAALGGV